jgi:hypothetical protein
MQPRLVSDGDNRLSPLTNGCLVGSLQTSSPLFYELSAELKYDRLYQFSASPPQVGTPAPQTHALKEWGVPSSDEELFMLEALEVFLHLKLEAPRARPARKRPASQDSLPDLRDCESRLTARSSTYQVSLEPPTKRPRYDVASISHLIPQVHNLFSLPSRRLTICSLIMSQVLMVVFGRWTASALGLTEESGHHRSHRLMLPRLATS